jgi:predicted outer membrane repeat protein
MRLTHRRQTRVSSLVRTKTSALISLLVFITVIGYLATNFASSKATTQRLDGPVTVHAAGRGNPWINLQDGRDLPTVYKGRNVAQALQGNSANPLTLASADFDEDGVPDLVVGYGLGRGGALSVYRGNINAFAPQTEDVWRAVSEMRYPDPFFPDARSVDTLLPPEFLGTGDFNSDGHKDLLIAAKGSNILEVCLGNGQGSFTADELRYLPGSVTSMLTDDIGRADGLTDIVIGVAGASGPAILVFNGTGALSSDPASYPLAKAATALASGRLGKDGAVEIVAAAENEVVVLHNADRQEEARMERFNLPFRAFAITLGRFIWDREGSQGVAVLGDDGAVHLLTAGRLDTRPYTQHEIASIRENRFKYGADSIEFKEYLKTLVSRPDKSRDWIVAESVPTGVSQAENNSALLVKAGVSAGLVDDLAVVDSGNNKLHVIRNRQIPTVPDKSSLQADTNVAQTPLDIPLDVEGAPVALLSMRLNVDTLPDLVVLRKGQMNPATVITVPLSTYVVNNTADVTDATPGDDVCATAGAVCTLRAAIVEANHHVGPDAITLGAGTYQLTLGPSDNERLLSAGANENTGDLDIIDFDGNDGSRSDLTINGAAPGTTFIQAGASAATAIDRAIDINNPKRADGQGDKAIAVNINNVTVRFSAAPVQDVPSSVNDILEKGGGIQNNGFTLIGTAGPTTLALTLSNSVVTGNLASGLGGGIHSEAGSLVIQTSSIVSSNTCQGGAGGGIDYAGGNSYIGQGLTISSSTIGGAGAGNTATPKATPFPNQGPLSGGGVATFAGSTVTITSSTIQANVADDATGAGSSQQNTGGGGLFLTGNPAVTITGSTITGNTAKNNGGGIYAQLVQSLTNVEGTATINNTQITSNTADSDTTGVGNGGGIYNHRGAITIGNATACNINSNTAADGGGIYVTWNAQTNDVPSSVTMTNGTLNSNNARNNGGGLAVNFESTTGDASNRTATTTLTTVTLQSNTANSDSSGGGDGGAIFDNGNGGTFAMPVSLSGVTIDSNAANSGFGDGFRLNGGTMSASGTINVNGGDSIYIAGGTFNSTSGTFNLTGNFTRDSASVFNHNGGTFNFTNTFTQVINGTATSDTFNNFIVNKSAGTLATGGSTTSLIMNDLTMTLGTFTAPATLDINGNTLLSAGSTLTAGANITAAGNWTNNGGTFTPGSGLVTFDGSGPGSIIGGAGVTSQTFNNFAVNKSVGSTLNTGGSTVSLIMNNLTMMQGNFTAPATLDINGNTLLTAGILTAGANITAAGNWTNNGGTFTPGSGLVMFDGATANNLTGSAVTQTFNNFEVNKGAGSLTGVANTATLTLNGGMTLTSGTFAAGSITAINLAGNWTNNGGIFTPGTSNVTFNSTTAPQSINGTAVTQTFFTITVNKPGQTLSTGGSTTALDLDGSLVLTAGTFTSPATLNIGGSFTEDTGFIFTPPPSITFDGSAAGNINGTLATKTFNNVVINKTNFLTGSGGTTAIDINGSLTLTAGTFVAGTAANITLSGNFANSGTFTGTGNTFTLDGAAAQTVGGTGASNFNNLTDANTLAGGNGITLGGDINVSGVLALGTNNIDTSTFTLIMPATGSSTGTGDVIGNVKRTGLVVNTTYSFGNPFNTIKIESGSVPTDINVNLVKAAPADFPLAVQRKYTITPNGANGNVTLRLHYLDTELNGNDENTMIFRRFNGLGWQPVTPTSRDTTANWLEKTGQPNLSPWTFSSTGSPTATPGTIIGRITDIHGLAVAGAVVNVSGTQNRNTITDANGNYSFANVETSGFYTVSASRANYSFSPQERSFSQLGNQTEAAFTATPLATTINPLDTAEYFVRQHYLDFLGREPEEAGFNFWSDRILGCGGDAACVEVERINVSAAYFLSIEFQETGGLVDGLYRASFDRAPQYAEFMPDAAAIAKDIVVGRTGWEQQLAANKQAFLEAFVGRAAFQSVYGGLSNDQYVDQLLTHTHTTWTQGERAELVNGLASGTLTRAGVLGQIAKDQRFIAAKRNEAFVMMEYFGYLRRDPDADGYQFWLNKLNQFNGNFDQAEMVKAFIVSIEYRQRFPR